MSTTRPVPIGHALAVARPWNEAKALDAAAKAVVDENLTFDNAHDLARWLTDRADSIRRAVR